jgi:CRP-like cAMP-binding protein
MNSVIGAMEELSATPGQYIIKEGEKGDTLYIVSSGEYDCTKVIAGK